ncbi:aminodeoxychorismate synthase component I [Rhodobacter sp. KR11]|uniref:aminodeoxychorismate synthase component I n=1 Tax=Rhodobacter sp. KR11 TaxID=2974588 RepID=UPI002222EE33|nr:aminodeoxychorismate synthase component I [Rhodobacter sp. KR11]MCW1920014.1 aminodeoxychorismate synthase component I [Rhodobacter sp. KR11]
MILMEHGPGGPVRFDGPCAVITARRPEEVLPALQALDAARAKGKWVAGWMAYEAGFALEPALARLATEGPLLAFGVYDGPQDFAVPKPGRVRITAPRPLVSWPDYAAAMARVKAYIGSGDCYQINLTFPMESRLLQGSALELYAALRGQAVGYGAYAALPGMPVLVSRSPELFLRTDAAGRIESRPMKGTAPRDPDPVRDLQLAEELRASEKGRAENLMIVDLLRNDISRIAKVGSVRVPQLFSVEAYATVHQMISRVVGDLVELPAMTRLMEALFPCGSITGAPKIRAMEIIAEVEPHARGPYCGAIGWMAPDGASCFNVAIRTLQLTGDRIRLNVGGGVVQDSTAEGEWEEAHWKARYLNGLVTPD